MVSEWQIGGWKEKFVYLFFVLDEENAMIGSCMFCNKAEGFNGKKIGGY